jgi:hypothetical protein
MPPRGKPNIPPRQRTKLPEDEDDSQYHFQYDPDRTDPTKPTPAVQADKRPDEERQNQPAPVGETTGANTMKATSSKKKKPKRKGKGKKRATTSDEESDYNTDEWWPDESEDITKTDSVGLLFGTDEELVTRLIAASAPFESDAAETMPGTTDSEAAGPPPQVGDASTNLLQPPQCDDTSSSASSRGPKRRRDASPPYQRKTPRESRRGGRNPVPGVAHPHSPVHSYRQPPPRTPSPSQERIRQLEAELRAARDRLASEYHAGIQEGRACGFEDAIRAAGYVPRSAQEMGLPPSIREPPRGCSPPPRSYDEYDCNQQHARDLQRAMEDSRRESQYGSSREYDSSAGPSRQATSCHRSPRRPSPPPLPPLRRSSPVPRRQTPPPPRRHSPGPPRPSQRPREAPPARPATVKPPEPRHLEITVRAPAPSHWTDVQSIQFPDVITIPLPLETKAARDKRDVTISCENVPLKAEDANSYLELWSAFAMGLTMPDAFTRLFQARGRDLDTTNMRRAGRGYILVRCIAAANEGHLSKNALRAFLVILATYQRFRPLLNSGIWQGIMNGTQQRPLDNWGEVRHFNQHV